MPDIHPKSDVQTQEIGLNTVIGPFAVVEQNVMIAANVIIRPHAVLEKNCRIDEATWVGEGAIVRANIHIGPNTRVAPYTVVERDIPGNMVIAGQPARPIISVPYGIVHPQAIVESTQVGNHTRIWAFCHVLPGAKIGQDVNLCDHTFVENDVVIGNRVTVKCGVQLWDGIRLEDEVFIGPNVTFTNDAFPRSKHYPDQFPRTLIKKGASVGANATILPGITIGEYAMIGAGAVVTGDIPAYAVAVGNPAKIIRTLNKAENEY